jgi:hypothetical protein
MGATTYNTTYEQPVADGSFGNLIATMDFPDFQFGPNNPYLLDHTFSLELINPLEWEFLWRRWWRWSLEPADPLHGSGDPYRTFNSSNVTQQTDESIPLTNEYVPIDYETGWKVTTSVNLYMLGMEWKNIPLVKYLNWNGGEEHLRTV